MANRTICIDTRMLGGATGVASYTRAVLEALDAVGLEPLRLADANGPGFGGRQGAGARVVRGLSVVVPRTVALDLGGGGLIAPDLFRRAQAHFALHRRVLHLRTTLPPGTVHWMYPVPACIDGWRNVYTLHDAIPVTHPAQSAVVADALRARVRAVAVVAAGFVTVSAHARGEIVDHLDIAPDRIVSCGLAMSGMTVGALPAKLAPALVDPGYLIAYGSTEARKNIGRTVAAWRASGSTRRLVIVAADVDDPAPLHARLGGGERLVVLPRLDRPALLAAVEGARAVMFASLAEGFGLPIVEAMALGVPVLTSAEAACAETAGGAALLVDPADGAAMAAAIARLSDDDDLCGRLVAAGRARVHDFAPAVFGQRLLAAYDRFGP